MESILNSERKRGVPKNYFRLPLEPELETAVDKFVATVSGMDIVVGESAHVQAIYSMGNFGTFVGQRQGFANVRCFEPSSSSTAKNVANADGEMEDKQPERFTSTKGRAEKHAADWTKKCVRAQELLHLSPWEAFYLANDLNVLKIVGANIPETLAELFTHFCSIFGPAFVRRYRVYRYFRRIGWVVRDGLTFAVDFLLYKDGVEVYHAAAGVRILQSVLDPVVTDPTITATQRELANCKKRLLLAAVDFLLPENKLELKDLELAKVRVLSLSKWSVNKSRISDFKQ